MINIFMFSYVMQNVNVGKMLMLLKTIFFAHTLF